MKKTVYLPVILALILFSCKKSQITDDANGDAVAGGVKPMIAYASKWGAIVNKSSKTINQSDWGTQYRLNAGDRVNAAADLGVSYYRMQLNATDWIANVSSYQNDKMNEFKLANQHVPQLKVMLNIFYQTTENGAVDFPSGDYSDPASQMRSYGDVIQAVLIRCNTLKYKPALIVVENEEDNQSNYNIQNGTQYLQYEKELSTAKTVCSAFQWWDNTTGVDYTNGGITARKAIYATFHYYTEVAPTQNLTYWKNWAYSVLPLTFYYGLTDQTPPTLLNNPQIVKESNMSVTNQIKVVDTLLAYYSSVLNLKYVNMHWYEPVRARSWDPAKNGNINPYDSGTYGGLPDDKVVPNGLANVASLMGAKVPGAFLMSNEIGQLKVVDCLTRSLLYTANSYLKFAVLYDGDDDDYTYGAKAYHNTTGVPGNLNYNLRSTGTTVNAQISSSNPSACP